MVRILSFSFFMVAVANSSSCIEHKLAAVDTSVLKLMNKVVKPIEQLVPPANQRSDPTTDEPAWASHFPGNTSSPRLNDREKR
jgi:hypothetical protein